MESYIAIKHIWFGGRLGHANPTSYLGYIDRIGALLYFTYRFLLVFAIYINMGAHL